MESILNKRQFNKFKSKYSSLKRNAYIPDLKIGEKVSTLGSGLRDKSPNMESILDEIDDLKNVEITNFIYKNEIEARLYEINNQKGFLDNKMYQIFKDYEMKTKNKLETCFFFDEDNCIGVLMPIKPDIDQKLEVESQLNLLSKID